MLAAEGGSTSALPFPSCLVSRLIQHLEEVGPGFSQAQFGFRASWLTIDVLNGLKTRLLVARPREMYISPYL